jgi:hypothetical protein
VEVESVAFVQEFHCFGIPMLISNYIGNIHASYDKSLTALTYAQGDLCPLIKAMSDLTPLHPQRSCVSPLAAPRTISFHFGERIARDIAELDSSIFRFIDCSRLTFPPLFKSRLVKDGLALINQVLDHRARLNSSTFIRREKGPTQGCCLSRVRCIL